MAGRDSRVARTTDGSLSNAAPLPKRGLQQWCEDGSIAILEGSKILWQGMPADLAAQPDLVAKVWPRGPEILRRAVGAARGIQAAERGRQRGCTPRRVAWTERLPDRAYLGTPIYRVTYIKDGKECRAPGFALKANALKAKALLQAKYGKAYVGQ